MKRLLLAGLALCASAAFADETKTSAYAEACCRVIDMAAAAGAWHWSHSAWIDEDAVFQDELRTVFAERFTNEWHEAQSCMGNWDNPKMKGLGRVFNEAVWMTETGRRIAHYAAAHGFCTDRSLDHEKLRLTIDADGLRTFNVVLGIGGRAADVTLALRATLRKFRSGTNVTEIAYDEWNATNVPSFRARGYGENGKWNLCCRYETWPETECAWQGNPRELGKARTYAEFDCETSWRLLARRHADYSYEDVLKALGRPKRSNRLRCQNCGKTDMRWTYEISDADNAGKAIRHTLEFSFANDGRCARWEWRAE